MSYVLPPLYATAATVLAALVLAFAGGGLSPRIALCALVLGAVVGGISVPGVARPRPRKRRIGPWEWVAIVAFALFALRAFLWVVFTRGDEIRVLSPNNLGDLSLHLTYIRELANGVPFWPENPIVAHARLTYPLGVDLLHSLLFLVGADLYRTFVWMGLLGAAATGLALWRWGRGFAVAGFLCNGGVAGFLIFADGRLIDFQAEAAWKSIPLALFVTQRGFLFALPAGLALLASWRERFFGVHPKPGERSALLPLWGELLLYASMPVFHLHTFIFLSLLLLAWFVMHAPARRQIITLVALALVPATLLTLEVTAWFQGPKSLGWAPGWMQSDPEFLLMCSENLGITSPWLTIPAFWLYNFGVLPLLVGALCVELFRSSRHPESRLQAARAFVLPALSIFLLCCFVKFAVWEWDNTKLMIWSYLLLLPFLWRHLLLRWPVPLRVAAVVLLFFSGGVSLLGGLNAAHRGYPIANRSELDPLEVALRDLPATARIVAQPSYNHPLLLLGRLVPFGYEGHVWSHGYEFVERKKVIMNILDGGPGWREQAHALGCRYLFWGAQEEAADQSPAKPEKSLRPWEREARVVFTLPQGTLYDLGEPPAR